MEPRVRVQLVRDASMSKKKITCAREVVALCKDMRKLDREHFRALYLDARNGLHGVEAVAIGSLNASLVHPREVSKAAILLNAAALILVHNHPSGAAEMSEEDHAIIQNLIKAGELSLCFLAGVSCSMKKRRATDKAWPEGDTELFLRSVLLLS